MFTLPFTIVDVFTDTPLAGNQLGVFTDARALSSERMQALTLELGFSECTFVLPPESEGDVRIRIFTPAEEIPFAGHPVLGTAFVLGGSMQQARIALETGSGVVPVDLEREGAEIVFGRMTQPIPNITPLEGAEALLAALNVESSELPIEVHDNGVRHAFVTLSSPEAVADLSIDVPALVAATDACVNCVAVDGTQVKTRMFAPDLGVLEDAATGSAAGPLAVHLARHGWVEWGREIRISQGAEIGRPSTLYARTEGGPDGPTHVEVGGAAALVAKGEFVA